MTVLAVTGLKREAEIAAGPGVVALAGGGAFLKEKLDALHGDISGVISIGLGGGLSPLLRAGEAVIADHVIEGRHTWPCSNAWRVALAARLPRAHQGPVVASETILEDAHAKALLYETTGALAVDMESGVAARFAYARGLSFAVLRIVSDDSRHRLPPAALVAMKPDGGISASAVARSLLRHPLQLPRLVATAASSNKAFKELLRCRGALGVGLARPDI